MSPPPEKLNLQTSQSVLTRWPSLSKAKSCLELLWEIPLSGLSFLFSRLLRAIMQGLIGWYTRAERQKPPEWQLVSAQFLEKPVKLLWAMTRARWNLHAIVAIASPLPVKATLSLDVQAAHRSAQSWTVVVYHLPSYRTVTSLGSREIAPDCDWASLSLPPGTYLLGLRYYHWADTVEFPAVKVDGIVTVAAVTQPAPADINRFYRDLQQRRNFLHVALNYYVFNLLRFRRWLPEKFVQAVFLPVPNPETRFYYGVLKPEEVLTVKVAGTLFDTHDLYFSLYSRDCFPLDWYKIIGPEQTTARRPVKQIYLMRVHQRSQGAIDAIDSQIQLTVNYSRVEVST